MKNGLMQHIQGLTKAGKLKPSRVKVSAIKNSVTDRKKKMYAKGEC